MTSATPQSYFPEETVAFRLGDLTNETTDTPITTGAVVTFQVTDLADTEMSTGVGTATDDDWVLLVDTPAITGSYFLKVTAVADGATGKWKDRFDVSAF